MTYAELWTAKGREAVVRVDSEAGFFEDVMHHFQRKVCRKRYREEREHPEWVDLGGES